MGINEFPATSRFLVSLPIRKEYARTWSFLKNELVDFKTKMAEEYGGKWLFFSYSIIT